MLIPRFTVRFLLALTTAAAVFCLAVLWAVRGSQGAIVLVAAAGSLALLLVLHVSVFLLAFGLARIGSLCQRMYKGQAAARSPFATDALPPQQMVPLDDVE